jgi:hypothetical protein
MTGRARLHAEDIDLIDGRQPHRSAARQSGKAQILGALCCFGRVLSLALP